MHTPTPSRRGFSLIELTIALGVFAILIISVLQAMVGISGFVSQEEGMGDDLFMGRQAINQITSDMANTAWFYSYNAQAHQFNSPLTPLYPLVTKGTPDAHGNELDSIEFIKIRTSTTVAWSPYAEHYSTIPFYTYTSPPAVWTLDKYNVTGGSTATNSASATASPLLVANPNYPQAAGAFDVLVSHVWESAFANYTFDQNMDPTMLRHTRLEVVTNSQGIQQLIRSYYNGDGGTIPPDVNGSWNASDQLVLMDYVTSFVINTQLNTQGTGLSNDLQTNQLSFVITVVKPEINNPTVTSTRTFTAFASMRSISH